MRLSGMSDDFSRCGIDTRILMLPFLEWRSLPKVKGCYSIWQGDRSIYVGKAGGESGFRGRFVHHYAKAFGKEQSGTTHTEGWIFYRGEQNSMNWDPDSWEIEYFEVLTEVHRTYLEAAMILMFDPLCNDESFKDRHHKA